MIPGYPRVFIQKVSRFSLLIRSCQSELELCIYSNVLKYNHREMDSCNQTVKSYLRALLNAYIKKKVDVFFQF